MFLQGTSRITPGGELSIGGVNTTELIERFGTPLIVYDEELIRSQMRAYMEPFKGRNMPHRIAYACKAFSAIAICQIAQQEGLWLDVVSAGELYTAQRAGFPADRIFMHGNNKTREELEMAVRAGVAMIVVDNFYEISLLSDVLNEYDATMDILLRIAPGVDAHTHEYITTGQQDSKFGFDLFSGQVDQAVDLIQREHALRLVGLHSHIGSQIFDVDGFRAAALRMADTTVHLKTKFGLALSVLNLGGGLGVRYTQADMMPPIAKAVAGILDVTEAAFAKAGVTMPTLMLEPGRSIVAAAGTTLYRVGSRKQIPEVRTYVAVDGGMTDNPRLALYGAKYEACIANRMLSVEQETVSIAGKCCESGDMLIWDAVLPVSQPGDILAVSCTGAYNYAMASNYNRIARPAVVFVHNGTARLVIRRETLNDLVALDIPFLQDA
ncbi:MAG: diaminopimelate decarboxylase [Firmicutes bacterium]|nr:diaminopimelate decarboxylase [Bacillota bacterium]